MAQKTASDVQTPPYRQTAFEIMLRTRPRASKTRRGGGPHRGPADG